MDTQTSEAKTTVENKKSGTQTGHTDSGRLAKTSVDYWKTNVGPRKIRGVPSAELYVRFREAGRDVWICLDTANRNTAAAKARDYWVRMKAIGLAALVEELRPEPVALKAGTVGEAIEAAARLSTVRTSSFLNYAKRLRQIAAGIAGIERPKKALSRTAPEAAAWKAAVGRVRLDRFTATAVSKWKAERVSALGSDPVKKRSATVTADGVIRMARAIFSKDIIEAGLGKVVALPNPLPFTGIPYGRSTRRFIAPVDPAQLFAAARAELEQTQPQVFLAFSLSLLVGLRRSEGDTLTWPQLDFERAVVRIQTTEYFEPKSEESTREIELDEIASEIFRRAKADNPDPVFVLKGGKFRRQTSASPTYRADAGSHRTWKKLLTWLRSKGVTRRDPIHTLRKLAGSFVFETHGLEQARGFLGHGDVSTTSRSYLAKTKRVVVSLPPPSDEVSNARKNAQEGAK